MTDINFVLAKSNPSNKFAVHRNFRRRGTLRPRFSEWEDSTAYWTLKQHLTGPHAYLRAPHKQARGCTISLGDPHTFLYSSNAQIHA